MTLKQVIADCERFGFNEQITREALMQREYIAHEIYAMHCRHTDCQPYAWKDLDPRHRNEYRERADDAVKRFHSMEISSMNDGTQRGRDAEATNATETRTRPSLK